MVAVLCTGVRLAATACTYARTYVVMYCTYVHTYVCTFVYCDATAQTVYAYVRMYIHV